MNDLINYLKEVVGLLGVDSSIEISEDTNLKKDLNIDSFAMMQIIMMVEEKYEITVKTEYLTKKETYIVSELYRVIKNCRYMKK